MSIEAIAAVGAATAPMEQVASVSAAQPASTAFDSLVSGLRDLNSDMIANQNAVADLALGKSDNLHQVMMRSEQTRLDFELMMAVRNKVLEAYQELMRMQV
jgi:flagellar hook-basal body complex protein FliE